MKSIKLILVFFFIFSLSGNLNLIFAQTGFVKTALEISKGTKIKYVKTGKRVRIWYEGQKYKIWIDSIGPDKLFSKDNTFEINKIDKIAIKYKASIITGSIIGTTGLIFTGIGTAMIIKGSQSKTLGGAFAVAFGLVIDIIGVTTTAVGSVILFIGKKYKKSKDWKFKAVQLE